MSPRTTTRRMPKSIERGGVSKHALLSLRRRIREAGLNPKLAGDTGTLDDLSWRNFVKEVFLDSETTIGLISTPPGPYPQEAVVPPKEMAHIRDEINRLAQSQRMLAHGLATPQLGAADLDFMAMQAEMLKVDAWKCYTGSCPKGFDRGWWMDDETIAYPMLEQARKLNIKRVCVHKGLPLGLVPDYNHPKDLIKAAKDFPDIDFLVYHSGLKTTSTVDEVFAKTGEIPWTTEFCRMKQAQSGIKNIYMELARPLRSSSRPIRRSARMCLGRSSTRSASITCSGGRTPSGMVRRNGRSKPFGDSRFRIS